MRQQQECLFTQHAIIQNTILGVEYHHKICASHFDNKHLYYNFICNTNLSMLTSSTNILLLQQSSIWYNWPLTLILPSTHNHEKGKRTITTSVHLTLLSVTLLNLIRFFFFLKIHITSNKTTLYGLDKHANSN